MSHYDNVVVNAPQDSETFVRVPLTSMSSPGMTSCCGEACFARPEVEFLTSKWSVFLKDHMTQEVFDAMMVDIYNNPKFQAFLKTYYSPAASVMGFLFCCCISVPFLLRADASMKTEIGHKLSAWNKVLGKWNCGVSMQINEHGLVFNILPSTTLFKPHDSPKTRDECTRQLLVDLGLSQYH